LLRADQIDLNKSFAKAIEKGYPNMVKAIESFIIEEKFNVSKTKKLERSVVRKRPMRTVRPSRYEIRA